MFAPLKVDRFGSVMALVEVFREGSVTELSGSADDAALGFGLSQCLLQVLLSGTEQ